MNGKYQVGFVAVILISLAASPGFSADNLKREFSLAPLRDPFWPVGYFPEDWQMSGSEPEEEQTEVSESNWDGPAAQIRVTGTSRMDDKSVAIINGDIKEVGDFIEVSYSGQIYQWKLKKIDASGQVFLDRVGISAGTIGFHPGDKK